MIVIEILSYYFKISITNVGNVRNVSKYVISDLYRYGPLCVLRFYDHFH